MIGVRGKSDHKENQKEKKIGKLLNLATERKRNVPLI